MHDPLPGANRAGVEMALNSAWYSGGRIVAHAPWQQPVRNEWMERPNF
jgi:hypothetical protein